MRAYLCSELDPGERILINWHFRYPGETTELRIASPRGIPTIHDVLRIPGNITLFGPSQLLVLSSVSFLENSLSLYPCKRMHQFCFTSIITSEPTTPSRRHLSRRDVEFRRTDPFSGAVLFDRIKEMISGCQQRKRCF